MGLERLEEPRPVSLPDRARYRFDRTLARSTGTLMGWLVITCLAVVVPVSALLVWTDPGSPRSLPGRLTAVWRTSAETLRLGAVTGTPLRMLLSALLGLVALLCVSTLVGVITTGLADRLAELSRGRSTVIEEGHAVVLGWSDQVATVVGELIAAQAAHRPRAIVLLADRDKTEMERALALQTGPPGRARIICRSGPASDPDVLALVSPRTASTVLVLPSGEPTADAEVLRVLLALRAVLGEGTDGPPVLAAVRDDRYRAPARLAAGARGTVLETDTVTARLIAQCVGRPGLSVVLRDLLDFAGDEFHLADSSAFHGSPFGTVLLGHATSCLVGLLTPEGRTLLNPPADTVVAPGSLLIVLTGDDDTTRPEDCGRLVDQAVIVTDPPPPDAAAHLLLLGWNRRAPLIVDQLRRTAHPGSVLHVVTDRAVPGPAREPETAAAARLTVRFQSADLSRPETLLGLDLAPYDGMVVLGPDPGDGPDRPDDRTLVTLLAVRLLEDRTGREMRVVTELIDDRNRPLAPSTPAPTSSSVASSPDCSWHRSRRTGTSRPSSTSCSPPTAAPSACGLPCTTSVRAARRASPPWWPRRATAVSAPSDTAVTTGAPRSRTSGSGSIPTRGSGASGAPRTRWSSWRPNRPLPPALANGTRKNSESSGGTPGRSNSDRRRTAAKVA